MKKYVVMTNYRTEGWKIDGEADSFDEAIKIREEALSNDNSEVVIFTPVQCKVVELTGRVDS